MSTLAPSAFRSVPRTGVIFVTSEAARLGFEPGDPSWCNLGQGQPEAGELPGAPARVHVIDIHPEAHEYAPVAGLWELREAVAGLYNELYRRGRGSRYTAENVAITSGGRASLTRAAAALGNVNLGHFLPDYTAYEELLEIFRGFIAIPILLEPDHGYLFSLESLRREILGRGLGALLLSNPCNPTGKLIADAQLEGWVATARALDCSLLIDEFYSHYVWERPAVAGGAPTVSAAEFVDDVDRDPVVIFNGLTKNWRYPGWRVSWTVGPRAVIDAVVSAGSFLDGGGSRPVQAAALPLLAPEVMRAEALAIQRVFAEKRERMLDGVRELGIRVDRAPEGTFYVWGDLSGLPHGLDDGMGLFRAALEQKVIVVPGEFFDVNPGKRRRAGGGRFRSYARFSFGPSMSVLDEGLKRLRSIIPT
jgi:N-succinyldiaminopimelate aminotransferase